MGKIKRRFHERRVKRNFRRSLLDHDNGSSNEHIEETVRKYSNTRTLCSCFACGNPRRQALKRKDKLSVQEKIELTR